MSYKTILVHCDVNPKLSQRLQVAVELAQRFGACLVGVHVQVPIDLPAFSAGACLKEDACSTAYDNARPNSEGSTATARYRGTVEEAAQVCAVSRKRSS